MVIDLETERRNGLDESHLAKQVMRLMNLSEMCNGPFSDSEAGQDMFVMFPCSQCAYRWRKPTLPHPRVPKPLREVRDELIKWLQSQSQRCSVAVEYRNDGSMAVGVRNRQWPAGDRCSMWVGFNNVDDTSLACTGSRAAAWGETRCLRN